MVAVFAGLQSTTYFPIRTPKQLFIYLFLMCQGQSDVRQGILVCIIFLNCSFQPILAMMLSVRQALFNLHCLLPLEIIIYLQKQKCTTCFKKLTENWLNQRSNLLTKLSSFRQGSCILAINKSLTRHIIFCTHEWHTKMIFFYQRDQK